MEGLLSQVDSALRQELGGLGGIFGHNGFFLENDSNFDTTEYYANDLANYY